MYIYIFKCFPLIFINSNTVVGRKAQNIRICACPGRDRTNEEIAEAKKQSRNTVVPVMPVIDHQTQLVSTSSLTETPPTTPQTSTAPQTPPQEPSTSTGTDDTSQNAQVPKLTKKRCKFGVPCTIPKGKFFLIQGVDAEQWFTVLLLPLEQVLVHCGLHPFSLVLYFNLISKQVKKFFFNLCFHHQSCSKRFDFKQIVLFLVIKKRMRECSITLHD